MNRLSWVVSSKNPMNSCNGTYHPGSTHQRGQKLEERWNIPAGLQCLQRTVCLDTNYAAWKPEFPPSYTKVTPPKSLQSHHCKISVTENQNAVSGASPKYCYEQAVLQERCICWFFRIASSALSSNSAVTCCGL